MGGSKLEVGVWLRYKLMVGVSGIRGKVRLALVELEGR